MYTTATATRQQSLVAAAAAMRAMKRHACCKSQFKFKCFSCGEAINRGDKITRCNRRATGMTLRYRGADCQNGLTMAETAFYQAETGSNMWVHIGCVPCYWDSLPKNSKEYSRPALRPICTDWGVKVYGEFEEWCDSLPHHVFRSHPTFLFVAGYPDEKFMRDRIIRAVTRFQAICRGYICKKAYPEALRAAKATEAINLNTRATLSTQSSPPLLSLPPLGAILGPKWLPFGRPGLLKPSQNMLFANVLHKFPKVQSPPFCRNVAQRMLTCPSGGPCITPRASKGHPRTPQEVPKGSQRHPQSHKKVTKKAPRGSKENKRKK